MPAPSDPVSGHGLMWTKWKGWDIGGYLIGNCNKSKRWSNVEESDGEENWWAVEKVY